MLSQVSCLKCNRDKRKCSRELPSCQNCRAPRFVNRNPKYCCTYPTNRKISGNRNPSFSTSQDLASISFDVRPRFSTSSLPNLEISSFSSLPPLPNTASGYFPMFSPVSNNNDFTNTSPLKNTSSSIFDYAAKFDNNVASSLASPIDNLDNLFGEKEQLTLDLNSYSMNSFDQWCASTSADSEQEFKLSSLASGLV